MNLDALGNIGEFVGSIGVVVSLVYLGIQVRENTRSNYAASVDRIFTDLQNFMMRLMHDEKAGTIYKKYIYSSASLEEVDEDDMEAFGMILNAAFIDLWRAWEKYERKQVDADTWNVVLQLFRDLYFPCPCVRQWFGVRSLFPPAFNQFIGEEMKRIPRRERTDESVFEHYRKRVRELAEKEEKS